MEKIKKMGDGVCCPVGEICEEPETEEQKMDKMMAERGIKVDREYVNPMEIPYVPSSHVQELMARAKAKDKAKLKIVQKKT
tara:strand:+ start:119 stop:361 length:243 start_codon:yes stop_codon:yes gene_type:complete